MARATRSFESKLQIALDSRTGKLLAQMEGMAACAGIRDDVWNTYKARINHYGGTFTRSDTHLEKGGTTRTGRAHLRSIKSKTVIKIPERHFIDVPLRDPWFKREFERAIADVLKDGKVRTYQTIEKARENDVSASLTAFGGPYGTLLAVARELASAQVSAIYAATPENAPSTVKRKGKNTPLRDTEEMMNSIRGWVEK